MLEPPTPMRGGRTHCGSQELRGAGCQRAGGRLGSMVHRMLGWAHRRTCGDQRWCANMQRPVVSILQLAIDRCRTAGSQPRPIQPAPRGMCRGNSEIALPQFTKARNSRDGMCVASWLLYGCEHSQPQARKSLLLESAMQMLGKMCRDFEIPL